jgi:hypothetical protein
MPATPSPSPPPKEERAGERRFQGSGGILIGCSEFNVDVPKVHGKGEGDFNNLNVSEFSIRKIRETL